MEKDRRKVLSMFSCAFIASTGIVKLADISTGSLTEKEKERAYKALKTLPVHNAGNEKFLRETAEMSAAIEVNKAKDKTRDILGLAGIALGVNLADKINTPPEHPSPSRRAVFRCLRDGFMAALVSDYCFSAWGRYQARNSYMVQYYKRRAADPRFSRKDRRVFEIMADHADVEIRREFEAKKGLWPFSIGTAVAIGSLELDRRAPKEP